jgi:hypothetical protein
MAPSSFFLKAAALAALVANSGVSAVTYPYSVDPSDVYQGNGFFNMFDFFTVSLDHKMHL